MKKLLLCVVLLFVVEAVLIVVNVLRVAGIWCLAVAFAFKVVDDVVGF